MLKVYIGDKSIYSIELTVLGILLTISFVGFIIRVISTKSTYAYKILTILLFFALAAIPFVSGFFMNGYYAMRFLVALSIVIAGIIALGISLDSSLFRSLVFIVALISVVQFSQSANHLFASSNLSLQADRLVGERIIGQIDNAIGGSSNPTAVKYLVVIGYYSRPSTQLMPKIETFGASFFEWDQGDVWRVIMFLQTLGFNRLQALPPERWGSMIQIANSMPNWPDNASVRIINDTVLLKFSPYSDLQKQQICSEFQKQSSSGLSLDACVSTYFSH